MAGTLGITLQGRPLEHKKFEVLLISYHLNVPFFNPSIGGRVSVILCSMGSQVGNLLSEILEP